jgi:hypothetical protein
MTTLASLFRCGVRRENLGAGMAPVKNRIDLTPSAVRRTISDGHFDPLRISPPPQRGLLNLFFKESLV